MGTSAFDVIAKQTPTTQQTGSRSAFDVVQPKKQEETPLTPLGETLSYIDSNIKRAGQFFWENKDPAKSVGDYVSNAGNAALVSANRALDTAQGFYNGLDKVSNHIANTPISDLSNEAINGVKDFASSIHPVEGAKSLPEGLLHMFVEDPIGALTQTKNVDGVALPTTPQELADKYQSVAGTLAAGEIAKAAHTALLTPTFESATDAINAVNQPGIVKAGKVIGSDLAASTAAGFGQGSIAGLGHDDNLTNALAGALTFAPIGVAVGALGVGKYNDALKAEKGRLATAETGASAQDLAALNSLKMTSQSTLSDLSTSMESIMKTKNWVNAAILKRFKTGQGYVIDGITEDTKPSLPKGSYSYHSPASNSLLVTPFKLGSASEAFFKKNGFMPREVVNFGGDDHFVLKESPFPNELVVKNINNGREVDVPIEALRRNNTSLVSSSTMASMGDVAGDTKTYNSLKEMLQNLAPDSRGYQDIVSRASALERRVGSNGQESIADIVNKNKDLKDVDIQDKKMGYKPNVINKYTPGEINKASYDARLESKQNSGLERVKAVKDLGLEDQLREYGTRVQEANPNGEPRVNVETAAQDILHNHSALTKLGYSAEDATNHIKNNVDKLGDVTDSKLLKEAPVNDAQDLSKLIPQGKEGIELNDTGKLIKIVNRDANGNGNGIMTLQKTGPGKASIFTVYTDPSVRRTGIASKMYDAATQAGYELDSKQSGLTDQGKAFIDSKEKVNTPTSINPVSPQLDKPVKVIRAGLLNPENYLGSLAQKFTNVFNASDKPFNVTLDDFAKKYGISDQDKIPLQSAIYKGLSTDLASELLSKEEISQRQSLQKELEASNKSFIQETARRIDTSALTNGMYVDSEGGGRYNIRSLQDGTILKSVGSPNEAIDYIKESTQSNFPPLDGGDSGGVPTALGNIGGMGQPWQSRYTQLMKSVDAFRLGPVTRFLVPSVRTMGLVDNITNGTTKFLKDVMLPLQEAQNLRRNFTSTLDPLTTKLNGITNLAKGLSPDRLMLIGDNVTTRTPTEIINNLLSRKMFKTEVESATKWFKNASTKDVSDLLYNAKEISGAKIGTADFDKTLTEVGQNYTPEVLRAAKNLSSSAGNFDPKDFSPYAVLKLAKAYEDPSTAISRVDHALKYNLSPKEVAIANKLIDYYKDAFQFTSIDPSRQISGYLPDIVLHNAVDGRGSNINPLFARELTRVGITPKNLTEQNPLVAARAYHYGLINHASGFTQMVSKAQKLANDNVEALGKHEDPKVAAYKDAVQSMVNRHIDDVMGRKDPTEFLSEISDAVTQKLMGKMQPDIGSVMELFSLSKIALRFGLSVRDGVSALGRVYSSLGHDFAKEAFYGSLDNKYLEDLHTKGVFGAQDLQTILNPTSDIKLLDRQSMLGKVAGAGFKVSGQEMVYNRSLAGIYKATMKIGGKVLKQLKNNEIDKDEAYDKLGLHNYGPAVTQIFDNYVSSGKPDVALDFLGQMHGRTMSTVFGNNNNPIGWNSKVGKLLSQYGYWSTNASNTLLESATYGTKKQIAGRVLRTGIAMGAISAAGNKLGVDLHTWMFANPFEVLPGTGPLANVVRDTYRTYGKDPNMFKASMHTIGGIAGDFVPFTNAYTDWKRAYDANNPIAAILSAAPKAQ